MFICASGGRDPHILSSMIMMYEDIKRFSDIKKNIIVFFVFIDLKREK